MKLAAIDIGSNAVRLQITKVIEYEKLISFKKLEYVRFPLRLGHDVFATKKISEYNIRRFYKLMSVYKHLIDLYEVDAFYGCATSAMRESENGHAIIDRVKNELDLPVKIISGEEEAEMINKVILSSINKQNYIHIDVGGGSTEVNIYQKNKKIHSHSFQIGTVRSLEQGENIQNWTKMNDWVKTHALATKKTIAIGTGGNINKLFELSKSSSKSRKMKLDELLRTREMLKNLSLDEMLNKLQLNPDRADVIIPASKIYTSIMQSARVKNIYVPDVGLKDGINYFLYNSHSDNVDKTIVKN